MLRSSSAFQRGARAKRAAEMEPLRQGALDDLCGLYAIINGIRIAEQSRRLLSRSDCRRLFDRGLKFLERRGHSDVARNGIPDEAWVKVARQLFKFAAKRDIAYMRSGKAAMVPLPRKLADAMALIENAVATGVPVAIELRNSLNHYTVVCSFTEDRWLLFDSYCYRWLRKASLGVAGSNARHILGAYVVMFELV